MVVTFRPFVPVRELECGRDDSRSVGAREEETEMCKALLADKDDRPSDRRCVRAYCRLSCSAVDRASRGEKADVEGGEMELRIDCRC